MQVGGDNVQTGLNSAAYLHLVAEVIRAAWKAFVQIW